MATPIELLRQKLAQQGSATSSAYRTPTAAPAPPTNRTQNTYGATQGPGVGATVAPGGTTQPSTPPPASNTAASVVPTGQNARIAELFPEYIDPATGRPYQGATTTYNAGGSRNPSGSISPSMTRQRTTPETHPWLYPQGGKDFLAGKDYSRADWAPGGIAQGFPEIPSMTQAERQSAADSQNYFRNEGQGIDPTLLRGMQRSGGGSTPYSNQFGNFRPPSISFNPATRSAEFFGSRFSGQDQSGNPFSYSGQVPYGSRQMQAAQNMASRYGNVPGGRPGPSPGTGSNPQFGGPTGGPSGFNQPPSGGSGFNQSPFISTPQGMPPWLQQIMSQQQQAPSWWQGMQQRMFGMPTMGPGGMPVQMPGEPSTGGVNTDTQTAQAAALRAG